MSDTLKARGLELLNILCVTKDFDKMTDIMTENVEFQHDDAPPLVGRDTFISHYLPMLKAVPDFSYQIYDSVAEVDKTGKGGRVWIFSRLSGLPNGIEKDTIDMLTIDENGMLTKMKDVQRAISK